MSQLLEEKHLASNEQFMSELSTKLKCKHQLQKFKSKELETIKGKWYVAKLVQTAAQEASTEVDYPPAEGKQKITKCMDDLLSAECEELVKVSSRGSQPPLLGIEPAAEFPKASDRSNSDHRKLILTKICQKLLAVSQFYQPSTGGSGSNLLNAKALQLHHVVSQDKERIAANRCAVEQLWHQRILVLRKMQQVHSRNLHLLETLLSRHSLSALPSNTQTADHLHAKTEALAAKIGLIEKELRADTYTPQLVKELSAIRFHLDGKLMDTRAKLQDAEREYLACLSAGMEFQRIAREYSEVKKDFEAREWALNELKAAKQHKT